MPKPLLIVGASLRPWLRGAIQAGMIPLAFDRFADWDAQHWIDSATAQTVPARLFPIASYEDVIDRLETMPVAVFPEAAVVCGGAELNPGLMEYLDSRMEILGTSAAQLALMTDQSRTMSVLGDLGIPIPITRERKPEVGKPGKWLRKPKTGCGGMGIAYSEPAQEGPLSEGLADDRFYFQRYQPGASRSALLLSTVSGGRRITTMLGISQQLVGSAWLNARPFAYAGSIGCWDLNFNGDGSCQSGLSYWATAIADAFSLVGLWGFDYIEDDCGRCWVVDVNPRITASAELWELALNSIDALPRIGRCAVGLQALAARGQLDDTILGEISTQSTRRRQLMEGKAILYHPCNLPPLVVTKDRFEWLRRRVDFSFYEDPATDLTLADIPHPETAIAPGSPVLTIRCRVDRSNSDPQTAVNQVIGRLQLLAAEVSSGLADRATG